jgi:hypothetical protein
MKAYGEWLYRSTSSWPRQYLGVSFTPRPLFTSWEELPVPIVLGGPQSRYGRCGEEKIFYPTGTRPLTPRSSSPWLRYPDSCSFQIFSKRKLTCTQTFQPVCLPAQHVQNVAYFDSEAVTKHVSAGKHIFTNDCSLSLSIFTYFCIKYWRHYFWCLVTDRVPY